MFDGQYFLELKKTLISDCKSIFTLIRFLVYFYKSVLVYFYKSVQSFKVL